METNAKQTKNSGLPINSEEEKVKKASMRLYVYLVSISQFGGKDKPRFFTQKDFTVNKIHNELGIHDTKVKEYWRVLENEGLIKYQGKTVSRDAPRKDWEGDFMARKKNLAGVYHINKGQKYRIIPKETIDKIQKELLISEKELKVYLFLANMQEYFAYMEQEAYFSVSDIRGMLGYSKKKENNKKIILFILWLKQIGLVEYSEIKKKNNLGEYDTIIKLDKVNYYTKGGNVKSFLESDKDQLTEKVKQDILDMRFIEFEDEMNEGVVKDE